jgi:hypothetical protein
VHQVFHVSQLKPFTPDYTPVYSELPVAYLTVGDPVPVEIVDRRLVKKDNAMLQVLVKWSTLKAEETTWEDYEILCARFPEAAIWGQASSSGGASAPPILTMRADTEGSLTARDPPARGKQVLGSRKRRLCSCFCHELCMCEVVSRGACVFLGMLV